MEHRFVTTNDGFVRAIAICRQRLLDCSAEAVMAVLLDRGGKANGGLEAGITPTNVCLLFSINRIRHRSCRTTRYYNNNAIFTFVKFNFDSLIVCLHIKIWIQSIR